MKTGAASARRRQT